MVERSPCVLVLDVGKTNKKIAIYDREFRVLAEERRNIGTANWQGVETEQTGAVLAWLRGRMRTLAENYDIRAVSVTAHGATLALLDQSGHLAMPVVSYTASVGGEVQDEFYDVYGSREELLRETGSADIGFCNMGKVLYYMRTRRPEVWARCAHGLFYASYFAYELSGVMAMEPTFIGNHSYLWDYAANGWSRIARELGADTMFAKPVCESWSALGPLRADWAQECGVDPACVVAAGIHDSNANLLPYLVREQSDFVLASTGTWCVLMRPTDVPRLADEQIEANVFFNLSAFRQPVLTGLLPAGMEYEAFASFASRKDEQSVDAIETVVSTCDTFIVPGTLPDIPLFPGATPGLRVGNRTLTLDQLRAGDAADVIDAIGQRYFAALNVSLALATKRALGPLNAPAGSTIYIEGGFATNTTYCRILATLCPEYRWVLTDNKEGTSFGAAIAGWAAARRIHPRELIERFAICKTPIEPLDLTGFDEYVRVFESAISD